ncbi:MAG: hypothetical protein KDJ41_08390 [Hyphomicrobiaceae bacterium]|nr:hypothetical protein [Hyphomicrobiaceae bacterium]
MRLRVPNVRLCVPNIVLAIVALAMSFALAASPASAAPLPPIEHGLEALLGDLVSPAQSGRCVPSRCSCKGNRPQICTRDCRRNIRCRCIRGRYVCRRR